MSRIFLFSGTSEGREISEFLSENKIYHDVFLATHYGESVMPGSEYAFLHTGRLDKTGILEKIKSLKPVLIIDATHPYAEEVSENIREAVNEAEKLHLIRLQRDLCDSLIKSDADALFRNAADDVFKSTIDDTLRSDLKMHNSEQSHQEMHHGEVKAEFFKSHEEIASFLKEKDGNVLITTGANFLSEYRELALKGRIFLRILPSVESLNKALSLGLKGKNIIAMEGPFSKAMNKALIEQYGIRYMVTKMSGQRGGFKEKLYACIEKGIEALVLMPGETGPVFETDEAKKEIIKFLKENDFPKENDFSKENGKKAEAEMLHTPLKNISIVGIGVGNDKSVTVSGKRTVMDADLLIGARRMLEYGETVNQRARLVDEYDPEKVLDVCLKAAEKNIAILVSGDTGFYSSEEKIKNLLKNKFKTETFPAVSSVSYFSSIYGEPYSDAGLISYHGRKADFSGELKNKGKVFSLVSGVSDLNDILGEIKENFPEARVFAGFNLGLKDEEIFEFRASSGKTFSKQGLYILGAGLNGKFNRN